MERRKARARRFRIVILLLKRRNQIAALRAGDQVTHFAFARGKSTCFSS
jgi:hypothetical protein